MYASHERSNQLKVQPNPAPAYNVCRDTIVYAGGTIKRFGLKSVDLPFSVVGHPGHGV